MTFDPHTVFERRIARHIASAANALGEAQREVMAQHAARGVLGSGARLQRQAEIRNESVGDIVDWCLAEVNRAPGIPAMNRETYGYFVKSQLLNFLAQSRAGLVFAAFGPAASAAIAELLDKADADVRAAFEEFDFGMWHPRQPPGAAVVTNNSNSVILNNSAAGAIQQAGDGASQQASVSLDIAALTSALETFGQVAASVELTAIDRAAISAELDTLRPQLAKAEPNRVILREGLKSLRAVVEAIIGGLLTEALVPVILAAAPLLVGQ